MNAAHFGVETSGRKLPEVNVFSSILTGPATVSVDLWLASTAMSAWVRADLKLGNRQGSRCQ